MAMTITQLEYVIAVDRQRHFSRAAASCFVTQPTLSAQIRKLEDELGVIIFDRSRAPVVPTELGQRVIAQARLALAEVERIAEIVAIAKSGLSGRLRIGVIPTLAPYLLPLFVASLHKKHAKLNLEVAELTTSTCLDYMDRDLLDVAILATEEDRSRYHQENMFEEDMLVFANAEHRFHTQAKISISDLTADDVWLLEEGHCLRDEIVKVCRSVVLGTDRPKNLSLKIGSLEAVRDLVSTFSGYTLLPVLSTLKLNRENGDLLRSFSPRAPYRTVNLTRRRTALHREAISALSDEIRNHLPRNKGLRLLEPSATD